MKTQTLHESQREQIDELRDRLAAVELKLEHLHGPGGWHTHKERVKQMDPDRIAHAFDLHHAHLPKEYR